MRHSIKFLLGDQIRELRSVDPTLTVLDYLRQSEHRIGTKEGCAEGDCGACTVVIARLQDDTLRYQAVNACIMLAPALDGCQLLSVEDLRGADGTLHPIQRAMVQEHASQCGFCTPGLVMSLFALYHSHDPNQPPDLDHINDTLAGNLCRCTGYGPIIAAARKMHDLSQGPDRFEHDRQATIARLQSIQDDKTIAIESPDGRTFYAPATTDDLAELLIERPDAVLVAGATDVGLWVTKQMRKLDRVIYLGRVAGLKDIVETGSAIEIGAMASYAGAAPVIARHYPDFGEIIRRIGSTQIRNLGTIGGNIANGSPIGDSSPPLIALGATLCLRRGAERRRMPIEDFFIAYGQQDLRPGEFLEKIIVPKPANDARLGCYKISKRFDQDISAVLGAFHVVVRAGHVVDARIAFGGMAPTPQRALRAEAALIGKPWDAATVEQAMQALRHDFTPIDDMRASAGYRMQVARNLLMKLFVETTESGVPTRIIETREIARG
ncbi:MAG: xanthine dehydrogenase small subunit [Sphingomonadales bacterium]